jgi:hypothetical protein
MRRLVFRVLVMTFMTALAPGETPAPPPPATPEPALAKALKTTVSRAVGSYNSVDVQGLRREFSRQAPGLPDDAAFRRLFFRYYLEDLGRAKSMRLVPADSKFDPERAMLIYEGVFDRWPRVKVSANFIQESGAPKLVQLRFERIETGY